LLRSYVYPFLLPGLAALTGAALIARGLAGRTISWTLFVSAALGTACAFVYSVSDPSSYFLHPMTLGLAAVAPIVGRLAGLGARGPRAALATGALLGLAALVLCVPWLRTGQQRVRLFVGFDRDIHSMWQSIPMDSAIVFWTNDMYYKLGEYQLLDHEKPGIDVEHALGLFVPSNRARFQRRFGIDPVEGITVRVRFPLDAATVASLQRDAIREIEARVNALVRLPVIEFDPGVPTVRLLRKFDADTSAAPTTGAARPGHGATRQERLVPR